MHGLVVVGALLLVAPFWESKEPHDWSDREISEMLHSSPWARTATSEGVLRQPGVQTYLASARPIEEAEAEVRRRRQIRNRSTGPVETDEFREYLKEQKEKPIVLTIHFPDSNALANAAESKRMEEESFMKIGRKKYRMTGHFPPAPDDPYLRLIFPRAAGSKDKIVEFDLYLPGATDPYRTVEYEIKDMIYKGKLEL
jgi:hypothetical protein